MKVCKYCGCEYNGEDDIHEAVEGTNLVKTTSPPWVVEKKESYPIRPEGFSVCQCPCHWRNAYNKQIYIEAYQQIIGESK
jgi:hypothetical protein